MSTDGTREGPVPDGGIQEVVASQHRLEASLRRLLAELAELRKDVGAAITACSPAPPPEPAVAQATHRDSAGSVQALKVPRGSTGTGSTAASTYASSSSEGGQRVTNRFSADLAECTHSRPALGLPARWPSSVRVRDFQVVEHTEMEKPDVSALRAVHRLNSAVASGTLEWPIDTDAESPSFWYAAFALFGFVVLLHDMTLIPYVLAFPVGLVRLTLYSTLCSACFWLTEILVTLSLGLRCLDRGKMRVPRLSKRSKQYLRTWFGLDLLLVAADVTCIVLEYRSGTDRVAKNVKLVRAIKLSRLLRIAGFLRVLRVVSTFRLLFARYFSERVRVMLKCSSIAFAIMWATHITACGWFAVGRLGYSDTGRHWLDIGTVDQGEDTEYHSVAQGFQYMSSLHWAMQQLALAGSIDIGPTNSMERMYNLATLMAGFMFGSVLVSSLSASMVDLQTRRQDRDEKIRSLQRYLRQNDVPPDMAHRVMLQVKERLKSQDNAEQASVPALDMLSSGLRNELHAEICRPILTLHPLFRIWATMDPIWFVRFCNEVAKVVLLSKGDELFCTGAPASAASVVVCGTLYYEQSTSFGVVDTDVCMHVEGGMWLAESALWCEWVHVGTATCSSTCKLLSLQASRFADVCVDSCSIAVIAAEYCRQYHRRVVSARPPLSKWPTDRHVPFTEFGQLVASMSKGARHSIGAQTVRICAEMGNFGYDPMSLRHTRWGGEYEELLKEMQQGLCTLVLDASGKLVRAMYSVAMRIENQEGSILMQMGKWDGYRVVADLDLPSTGCHEDEVAESTLERMLSTMLAPLAPHVEMDHIEPPVADRTSILHAIQTKYMRTVCFARLRGECPLARCVEREVEAPSRPSARPSNIPSPAQLLFRKTATSTLGDLGATPQHTGPFDLSKLPGPAHFVGDALGGTYYAWVPPADLDRLERAAAKGMLGHWLSRLEPPVPEYYGVKSSISEDPHADVLSWPEVVSNSNQVCCIDFV